MTITGCDDGRVRTVRFRHNAAVLLAGVVAFLGALPLATSRAYLLPILLVPLALAGWGWRSGTDVDAGGLSVRALLGTRRLPWSAITHIGPGRRGRVHAVLVDGRTVGLPAVGVADLPRLTAAARDEAHSRTGPGQ